MLFVLPEHPQMIAEVTVSHILRKRGCIAYSVCKPVRVGKKALKCRNTRQFPRCFLCTERQFAHLLSPHISQQRLMRQWPCLVADHEREGCPDIRGRDSRAWADLEERQRASHQWERAGNHSYWSGLRQICKQNHSVKNYCHPSKISAVFR